MRVREIMSKDPACGTPETRLQEVARLMVKRDCGALPVIESQSGKQPVGVITNRQLLLRAEV